MNKAVAGILLAGAVLASVPWLGVPAFYESFLYLICHWTILALSWNILSGYSGYFSFGHDAFFGIGMYTSAGLSANLDWPFLWTLPVAAALAALLGVALGAVVFRVKAVRGELFALLTLAITFVVGTVILSTRIDGGPGVSLAGVKVPEIGPSASSSIYLMALGAVVFRVKSVRGELFALLTLAVTFVVGTVVLNTRIDGRPGIYMNAVAGFPPSAPRRRRRFT